MDRDSFDRIARTFAGAATRRDGLKAVFGAIAGIGTGIGIGANGFDAPEAEAAKSGNARKDSGSLKKDPGAGKKRRRKKPSGGHPTTEGPCGNGKRKDNICTQDSDCCTGICNTGTGKLNKDRKGRCRCMKRNQPCSADGNCCNTLTCFQGRCGTRKPGPTPGSAIPTGSPCTPADTCADAQASCRPYLSENPPGSFCLFANGGTCSAANQCVGQTCTSGVCASGLIPTGKSCVSGDVCADAQATCTQYTSGNPGGTYCLLAAGGTCDAADQCTDQACVNDACSNVPETCDVCSACAYQTVQAAIDAAIDGDTITIDQEDDSDDADYVESLVIDKNLTLRACNLRKVTIVNAADGDRVIRRDNRDSAVSLKIVGITIARNASFPNGGGISGWFDLSLSGTTTVRGGSSENVGAGVEIGSGEFNQWEDEDSYWHYNDGTVGPCTLIIEGRAQVTSSEAYWHGGGVWMGCIGGEVILRGSASITSCASGEDGGGLWAAEDVTITLEDAAYIGGNYAPDDGGGLTAGKRANLTMTGTASVIGNRAGDDGGGVALDSYGDLTLSGSAVIAENTSNYNGGGMINLGCYGGSVRMSGNSVIRGNTAPRSGGGIYLGSGPNPENEPDLAAVMRMSGQARVHDNATTDSYDVQDDPDPARGGGGGGAYVGEHIDLEMSDSATIDNNRTARWGGGVFCEGDATLKGTSAIRNNAADETGGGVFLSGPSEDSWDPDYNPVPTRLKVASTAKVTGNTPDQCNSTGLGIC